VFIAGMNGCGKSQLAQIYLNGVENVVLHDTRGTEHWEKLSGEKVYTRLDDLMKHHAEGKAIYRPRFEELTEEFYEAFYKWIYFRKNTTVWIDELMNVCKSALNMPYYLKGIYTRGRSRNTSAWGLTQRPANIPMLAMSEATHYFVFKLNLKQDRQRMFDIIGQDEVLTIPPEMYSFWYYNTKKMDKPILAKLQL
jgi:hypothetical protein